MRCELRGIDRVWGEAEADLVGRVFHRTAHLLHQLVSSSGPVSKSFVATALIPTKPEEERWAGELATSACFPSPAQSTQMAWCCSFVTVPLTGGETEAQREGL